MHNESTRFRVRHAVLATLSATAIGCLAQPTAEAPSRCGPVAIPGHYGPFDYVTEHARIEIVERFHFTPKVEALVSGESGYLGDDLSYTLNASPNHHRALAAIMKWGARTHSAQPPQLRLSIECYFDRALRFKAKDTVARTLFALYLASLSRVPEAVTQLDAASEFAEDNGQSHYNIGMAYLELGQPEKALREAHLALKLGFPGNVLVERLKAANAWKEASE